MDTQDICQAVYLSGFYRTATSADFLCLYRSPAEVQQNGFFSAEMSRGESFYETAYGIMFGEDGNFRNYYAFLVIPDAQSYALLKYIDGSGWFGLTWNTFFETPWLYSAQIRPGTSINQLHVERDEDFFRIWINDTFLGSFTDPAPLTGGYHGIINWSSQFETAIADFDNYGVIAWDTGGDSVGAANVQQRINSIQLLPEQVRPLLGSEMIEKGEGTEQRNE